MIKSCILTGYSGFIGSHLCKRLLSEGWIVYGIDKIKSNYNSKSFFLNDNFIYLHDDICTLKFLPDIDYIFNLAAETHVGYSIEDSKDFIQSNIEGVRNLLELIRKRPDNVMKKPVLLHFSTDEVYGDRLEFSADESDLLNPSNPYSASKAAADMLILAWARTYNLEYAIIRPTNNYGPNQSSEKFIPLCIKLHLSGKKIRLHNRGTPKRMWLHVEDTVNAVMKVVEKNARGIYNISGNLEQTNLSTAYKVLKALNVTPSEDSFDLDYVRQGQDMRYSVDDTRLKDLGWKCQFNFDENIQDIVNFYVKDPINTLFSVGEK
jgi:dTDP-glucose 4,6-dehydratase